MAIELVKKEEKLTLKHSGSKIFYRRISTLKRGAIIKRHTKRGRVDWAAVTVSQLQYIVTGWEGVQSSKVVIPYESALVKVLPEEISSELLELAGGATGEEGEGDEETAEKNLQTSSSGS